MQYKKKKKLSVYLIQAAVTVPLSVNVLDKKKQTKYKKVGKYLRDRVKFLAIHRRLSPQERRLGLSHRAACIYINVKTFSGCGYNFSCLSGPEEDVV